MVYFSGIPSISEQYVNYRPGLFRLFPCADYVLLNPQHVSFIQEHLQDVYRIKGKLRNSHTHTCIYIIKYFKYPYHKFL
jgi:hypothetical protein